MQSNSFIPLWDWTLNSLTACTYSFAFLTPFLIQLKTKSHPNCSAAINHQKNESECKSDLWEQNSTQNLILDLTYARPSYLSPLLHHLALDGEQWYKQCITVFISIVSMSSHRYREEQAFALWLLIFSHSGNVLREWDCDHFLLPSLLLFFTVETDMNNTQDVPLRKSLSNASLLYSVS